jgi:drug/metabolite transporter (DMT)-like permease
LRTFFRSAPFLAIVACLLWSTAFFSIKIGLRYTTPLHFAGIRFMLSGFLLMLVFVNFRKYVLQIAAHWKFILKVAMLQTGVLYFLLYIGVDMVPANVSAVISGASPLFVSLLAHFLLRGDRLVLLKTISITLGMTGIILIGADRFSLKLSEAREFWGIVILVLSNISSSMGNIIVARSKKRDIHPVVLNSAQLFTGGLMLYILSLFMEGSSSCTRPVQYYAALAWLVCISASSYTIWFGLIRRPGIKVSELNVWKFLIPVFGAVFSWIILPEEKPEAIVVAGMAIITLALLLLYYPLVRKVWIMVKQGIVKWRQ